MVKAPIIFKIKFSLPNKNSNVGAKNAAHVKYIATRPGVEKDISNEQEFDEHLDLGFSNNETYTKYMHERSGSHGLFGPDEKQPDLSDIQIELQNHAGIVWRAVISMREDDANYLGYTKKIKWEQSLRSRMAEISQQMGIDESNLRWVAAFHQAKGHPHVHVVFWEKEPQRNRGMLSNHERRKIKRILTSEFYKEERDRLGKAKTEIRKYVLEKSKGDLDVAVRLMKELKGNLEEIKSLNGKASGFPPNLYDDQVIELSSKLSKLANIMPGKGRKALAFMPENVKSEARAIADWIISQPEFKLETKKYIETAKKYSRQYSKDEEIINEAGKNAYKDIKDRVAQEILRQTGEIYKNLSKNINQIEKSIEYDVDFKENSFSNKQNKLHYKNQDIVTGSPWKFQIKTNYINRIWKSIWEIVKREQARQEKEGYFVKRKLQHKLNKVADLEK